MHTYGAPLTNFIKINKDIVYKFILVFLDVKDIVKLSHTCKHIDEIIDFNKYENARIKRENLI